MITSYVIDVDLNVSSAAHEAPPVCPPARPVSTPSLKLAPVVKEDRRCKRGPMLEAARSVRHPSLASRRKLVISRDRLHLVENCLLAVFGSVTAMLISIAVTVL